MYTTKYQFCNLTSYKKYSRLKMKIPNLEERIEIGGRLICKENETCFY